MQIDKVTGDGTSDETTSSTYKDGDYLDILAGTQVTWTYRVTNDGNIPLLGANITVSDSDAGVTPSAVTKTDNGVVYNTGDTNTDGYLDTDETWIYTAKGTGTNDRIYGNFM